MIRKFMTVAFIMTFSISVANAGGIGAIFDAGIDGIKTLLKKLDFDGKYVDDVAQAFDGAIKKIDGDELLTTLRRNYPDEINYDDFKKIFDDVVAKAQIPVMPRVRRMIAVKPTAVVEVKRNLIARKLNRAKLGELVDVIRGRVRSLYSDKILQQLDRAIDLGKSGTPSQKNFWNVWLAFSGGKAEKNGYWMFILDADGSDLDEIAKILKKVTDLEADPAKRLAKLDSMLDEAAETAAAKGDNSLRRALQEWRDSCAGTKCLK